METVSTLPICVDYIRTNGLNKTIEELQLNHNRHKVYPNLVLLKYDIFSPMANPVVQECRGIILDEANNFHPVCYPYRKFWNHGEGHAAPIDWTTAKCFEKLDGSIITLYFYNGQWEVSTSGTPDAMTRISNTNDKTFRQVFWETWTRLDYDLPSDTDCCYMFELCTEWNRVVVPHVTPRIVLHGIRRMTDFQEVDIVGYDASHGWEYARTFDLNSIDNILAMTPNINPMEMEGYVIRDGNFNRIKVKSPQYVALHHLKANLTDKNMLQLIRSNEGTEFLTYFPEMTEFYNSINAKFGILKASITRAFEEAKSEVTQKDFAMKVKDLPYSGILFALRKSDRSLDAILLDYNLNNLAELLDKVATS